MAPLVGPHDERYADFYTSWINDLESFLKELQEALESDMKEKELLEVVKKISEHYKFYYDAKQSACYQDILQTVIPEWRSSLEKAFLWLGGWLPSVAIQLVYALAGQQVEAELAELLDGTDTPTIASLTSVQLSQISDLQSVTCKEEETLSREMAILQQSFGDQSLLSLAQANHSLQAQDEKIGTHTTDSSQVADTTHGKDDDDRSDSSSREDFGSGGDGGNDGDSLDNALQEKLRRLVDIASKADVLRFATLQKVLDILGTYQKAEFLVSAGKLQITLRNIGRKLEEEDRHLQTVESPTDVDYIRPL